MQLFAVLGANAALSRAELETVLARPATQSSETVALFDDIEVELTKLQRRLGGTQKIGHIIGSFTKGSKEEIAEFMMSLLFANGSEQKISFGLSIYELESSNRTQELRAAQKSIGLEIKTLLKQHGFKARYVTSKKPTLSSADVKLNHLLERGAEFVILVRAKEILIGQTIVVQDFADWSHRDYDRPARDAKRGMLPPKLARMMINLTGVDPEEATLLDPFCGSGTVLMEGSLLGFERLVGSDISEKAVADSETNLEWLEREGHTLPQLELKESTAANVKAFLTTESIDAVATEPFLGKPRQGRETREQVQAAVNDLAQLYKESFTAIADVMKPGGVIVIASPIHYVGKSAFPVPTRDILTNLGLTELPLANQPVVYRREGQFVGRDIVRFKR